MLADAGECGGNLKVFFFFFFTNGFYFIIIIIFLAAPLGRQDLSPQPGIEPGPPAVETQSPNHCTTREFSESFLLMLQFPW